MSQSWKKHVIDWWTTNRTDSKSEPSVQLRKFRGGIMLQDLPKDITINSIQEILSDFL